MIILNNSTKVNKIVQIILRSSTNLNYTELIEKLQNKVNTRITDREMMLAFGLKSPSAITNKKKRNSFINDDELQKVQDYFAISLTNSTSDNCVTLDYYPNVFGSCGCGCMVFDESKEKISVAKDMIMNYSPNKVYGVMSAVGCSMSPKIEDGDKLIVEKWNGEQIKDNRVYLFRYNDELFIKRLVKNIDQIICISENPRFEDRIITDLKNFCLVGEIVGLWRERM